VLSRPQSLPGPGEFFLLLLPFPIQFVLNVIEADVLAKIPPRTRKTGIALLKSPKSETTENKASNPKKVEIAPRSTVTLPHTSCKNKFNYKFNN
jgi:hypothetical protein